MLATVLGAAALVAIPAVAPPPAGATSTYLCTGYSACQNAGYSHAGYGNPQTNRTMYWRMYAGHNCTNYVAYRMIKAGYSTERPWSGSGNATNWGVQMSEITDTKPAVGAVAWWRANTPGAGSSGHVAYVEKVVSSTEIVISEDSWSGDFHWRTLYKTGTGWPSGFIHFVDKQPPAPKVITAKSVPSVSGTPQVGVPLTGTLATFSPAVSLHSVQWLANGVAVPGATRMTYTPTADTVGKKLTMRDTGSRPGYAAAVATSPPTAAVAPGAMVRVTKPGITGVPEVDGLLSAVPGRWSPAPTSAVYRWRADGVWLGADRNGPTLTVTNDLLDKTISVVEVTKRAGYVTASNASGNVGPVVSGVVELTAPFQPSGSPRLGSTLTFAPGTWTPADAVATYVWSRDGVAVPGAVASTYPLTAADVGHRITVTATVSREKYQAVSTSADFGTVTTPSRVAAHPGGRKGAAIVRVRISAPGVASPTGTVWARIGEKVARGSIVNGFAELRLDNLTKGTKTMLVLYDGNGVVEQGRAYVRVVVKPKKRR